MFILYEFLPHTIYITSTVHFIQPTTLSYSTPPNIYPYIFKFKYISVYTPSSYYTTLTYKYIHVNFI